MARHLKVKHLLTYIKVKQFMRTIFWLHFLMIFDETHRVETQRNARMSCVVVPKCGATGKYASHGM